MNTTTQITLAASLGLASISFAENGAELIKGMFNQTNHTPKVILDVRARYEYGNQENLEDANAATIRARLGLESQDYNGFSGLVEFEATRAANTDAYRAGNVHGDPAKTVIADPESTELNRIQLQFKRNDNAVIAGRQRIILDNARFVGNVGWRQNEQTFDALTYKNTMVDGFTFYYGYLDRVNRIFGSEAPKGTPTDDFESDSHLLNVAYTGLENHKIVGYAYLLDFDNSVANSSSTVGANYTFSGTLADDYKLSAYAELAYQQDTADNPFDYSAMYYHLNASAAREGWSGILGYEILGSDDGVTAFRTPLATAHKFNGWNDQFLVTPAGGLHDFYAGIGIPVPKVPVKLVYHYFGADDSSASYGHEFDAVGSYAINKKLKSIAKLSYFAAANDVAAFSNDRVRFSVELNYTY